MRRERGRVEERATALEELGVAKNVYHMRDVGINSHQDHWIKLLDAKFGTEPYKLDREDFEPVLNHFDVSQPHP